MAETRLDEPRGAGMLAAVSNALVSLQKEQFGRGPTLCAHPLRWQRVLVCTLEDALLPAERTMVRMGDQQRVRESRTAFQAATRDQFVRAVEAIIRRRVIAFASAIDADEGVVWEVFKLEPVGAQGDGVRP